VPPRYNKSPIRHLPHRPAVGRHQITLARRRLFRHSPTRHLAKKCQHFRGFPGSAVPERDSQSPNGD